jgi:hypothetical protein
MTHRSSAPLSIKTCWLTIVEKLIFLLVFVGLWFDEYNLTSIPWGMRRGIDLSFYAVLALFSEREDDLHTVITPIDVIYYIIVYMSDICLAIVDVQEFISYALHFHSSLGLGCVNLPIWRVYNLMIELDGKTSALKWIILEIITCFLRFTPYCHRRKWIIFLNQEALHGRLRKHAVLFLYIIPVG